MTIDQVSSFSYEEYLGWLNYFERRPYGWREDDRVFKILQTQGAKGKPWNHFPSLAPLYNPTQTADKNGIKNLKNSLFFQKMLSAKNGENLEILKELQ
jgi:hypothetical protein